MQRSICNWIVNLWKKLLSKWKLCKNGRSMDFSESMKKRVCMCLFFFSPEKSNNPQRFIENANTLEQYQSDRILIKSRQLLCVIFKSIELWLELCCSTGWNRNSSIARCAKWDLPLFNTSIQFVLIFRVRLLIQVFGYYQIWQCCYPIFQAGKQFCVARRERQHILTHINTITYAKHSQKNAKKKHTFGK